MLLECKGFAGIIFFNQASLSGRTVFAHITYSEILATQNTGECRVPTNIAPQLENIAPLDALGAETAKGEENSGVSGFFTKSNEQMPISKGYNLKYLPKIFL